MRLRALVEKQQNIKVIDVNPAEPDCYLVHMYKCERCNLDFCVSQSFQEQDNVCCSNCLKDDKIIDEGEGTVYKGVHVHG
ncbi:hypothetical protein [Rossellomorea sp. BNER]|uniref:hypothetical protein n=1 Tax=Rossellomorea sp. BNER TaxID=2962031 RepID=UPI003AF2FC28|nr:hypothetical protein [Rossellomorea sp. BNER]